MPFLQWIFFSRSCYPSVVRHSLMRLSLKKKCYLESRSTNRIKEQSTAMTLVPRNLGSKMPLSLSMRRTLSPSPTMKMLYPPFFRSMCAWSHLKRRWKKLNLYWFYLSRSSIQKRNKINFGFFKMEISFLSFLSLSSEQHFSNNLNQIDNIQENNILKGKNQKEKSRAPGIEPGSPEWQSEMLPLYHARLYH